MKQNLVIHRVLNKGRLDLPGLTDRQAFLSLSFKNFPESFASLAALLIKVKAEVQQAERLIGIVNQRQFFAKSGMAPQFPSNENPISLLALA